MEEESKEVESFRTNPLAQEPSFKSSEILKLIDLEQKEGYKNVLDSLGETKARVRAEHLLRLIEAKKIAWYKVDEPVLHEVMGIERAQHRRMKLIMAKLESRRVSNKNMEPAVKDKKVSFLERTAARVSTEVLTASKLERYRKYYNLSRPEEIKKTYEEADTLATEKTLAELQQIVIERLKCKAKKQDSQAFIDDMIAKEKAWETERKK